MASSTDKKSVQDIVVERLIAKIQAEKILPWHKPFQAASMNWFSKHEYRGINKLLLDGGEYITINQLKKYNETKGTTFFLEKGSKTEIVVFYSRRESKISEKQAGVLTSKGFGGVVVKREDGYYRISFILRYYRVINIRFIKDKDGNQLPSKLGEGNGVVETHTPSEEIIKKYMDSTGVKLVFGAGGAYYTESNDSVNVPFEKNFADTEAYYRVLFHEFIHSTGVQSRLNRDCYRKYHGKKIERSKEELVAEVGGLLLASEAGFREDTQWAENSENYIAGWCSWMKDNPQEVVQGMIAAEKASNYVLSGGETANEGGERSIDNPDKEVTADTSNGNVDDSAESEVSATSEEVIEKPTPKPAPDKPSTPQPVQGATGVPERPKTIKSIRSKKAVAEFYHNFLASFFDESKTEEERKEVLASIKAEELRYLYFVLTKEKVADSKKKVTLMAMISSFVEKSSRIG